MDNLWILTMNRSGSNFLCDLLNKNGSNPYFDEKYSRWIEKYNKKIYKEYIKNTKIFPDEFKYHQLKFSELYSIYPNTKLIFLRRKDKKKQAVSLYFHRKTGLVALPRDNHRSLRSIEINQEEILSYYNDVIEGDLFWETILNELSLDYLEIWYEDFTADIENYARRIFDYCSHDVKDICIPPHGIMSKKFKLIYDLCMFSLEKAL